MKIFFPLFFLLAIIACQESQKSDTESKKQVVKTNSETFVQEKKIIDTTSFEYFISKTDNYGELPQYLVDSFIGKEWYNANDLYQGFYGDNENKHYLLNGNFVLTFQITYGGVCSNTFLATYTSSGNMTSNLNVGETCDSDLSSAYYSFRYFEIFSDSLVEAYKKTIQAVDYKYSLPDSIEDLDEVETKEIIEYDQFLIKKNGVIEKQRKTKEIFRKEELIKHDKRTLRIMRNEFFARYGYKFNSQDLNDYFSHKDWYSPKFEDVSEKLTPFEIYNINLIKSVEAEK